jgi:4-amino-4-deoxy-L-arabinose transferase-like glycosyltransferase
MASTPWWRAGWLAIAVLVLHLAGASRLPLIDRDEPRFAEASREMLSGGDWIVPHFNQGYRFDKPVFIYWCQAASIRAFGDNVMAVRLPSIVASALTAVLIYGFGRRAAGDSVGVWAALIYTTSLQVMGHSKMAVADPLLILWTTAAFWAGWELGRPAAAPTPFWKTGWWWMFYGSLGLAFLAKGPVGWLPLFTLLLLWKTPEGAVARRGILPGAVLMVLLVAAWGVPALIATGGEFFSVGIGKHVVQRSVGALEGHGGSRLAGYVATLPFYFLTVFPSFLPWSWFLPWLVRTVRRSPDRTWLGQWWMAGTVVTFAVFTLVRTKLPHYTLPAFPLLALGLAQTWAAAGRPGAPLQRAVAFGAALGLSVSLVAVPLGVRLFPTRNLFEAAESSLKPEMVFASADYEEPSLVWYFRSKVRGYYSSLPVAELPGFMAKAGPRFCILPTADVAHHFPDAPAAWRRFRTSGFNLVHGRRVDLTLLLKPD